MSRTGPTEDQPDADEYGFVPTADKKGFMLAEPDALMKSCAAFAAALKLPLVDIGAAYGVASLYALSFDEIPQVIAVDPDKSHLDILSKKAGDTERLSLIQGSFPEEVSLLDNSVGAILVSRVFHFFRGDTLDVTFANIFSALVPGGKVFISAVSPYIAVLKDFLAIYEERVATNVVWPGEIEDLQAYLPAKYRTQNPSFFHALTPKVLSAALERHGFFVEKAEYATRPYPPGFQMVETELAGREDTVIIACKPK